MSLHARIILLALFTTAAIASAQSPFHASEPGHLIIQTDRYEAEFHGAALVRLVNRLTNQAYQLSDDDHSHTVPSSSIMPDRFPVLRNVDTSEKIAKGQSEWVIEDEQARYIEQSDQAGFTILIRIESTTGDLLISQTGFAPRLGARSLAWGIPALDQRGTDLIVPAYGGVHIDQSQPLIQQDFPYPLYWEFQLAIVQQEQGGFAVWSDDTTGQFKNLLYRRSGDRFSLAFETENPGPFRDKTEVRSVVWHLNVHEGDWRTAAKRYRDWMTDAFALTPWDQDEPWAKRTEAMVKIHSQPKSLDFFDQLAQRLDPSRTMIYLPDWRRDGYDVNYPDYTPSDWVKSALDHAHELGFKVMLHANLPGVSPVNPAWPHFKFWHMRDAVGFGPLGWRMEKIVPVSHYFINAGLADYRTRYVATLKALTESLPIDALHLDVSAPMWNDGQGLVEGMTYGAGVRELHRNLKQAMPNVVFGGENINELTLINERFYQVWKRRCNAQPHPVRTFLTRPFADPVGYLGMPNPDEGPGDYAEYMRDYEHWGVLPTLSVSFNNPELLDCPRTGHLLEQIRLWQAHGLKPDFVTKPTSGQIFRWKGEDGSEALLTCTQGDSVRMEVAGQTLFERIRGCNQYDTPLGIIGWPARDGNRVMGLNPLHQYTAAGQSEQPPVRVSGLTPGTEITTWRSGPTATLIDLEPTEGPWVCDLARLYPYAKDASLDIATPDTQQSDFSRFQPMFYDKFGGSRVIFESFWQGPQIGHLTTTQAATLTYEVDLPASKPLVLHFETALGPFSPKGQNARLRVDVNDEQVFSTLKKSTLWDNYAAPFKAAAEGKTTIRLAMLPEQADQAPRVLWRGMHVTETTPKGEVSLQVISEQPLAIDDNAGGLNWSRDIEVNQREYAPIVLYGVKPSTIAEPTALTALPFTFGTDGGGVFAPGMSAWGSGVVESAKNATGNTVRLFNAHPPSSGRTIFRQAVMLNPALEKPALAFTATVREGALTQGLSFEIRLNGRNAWHLTTDKPSHNDGRISLEDLQGKPLLIEWITDSMGDSSYDWAQWVDPRVISE